MRFAYWHRSLCVAAQHSSRRAAVDAIVISWASSPGRFMERAEPAASHKEAQCGGVFYKKISQIRNAIEKKIYVFIEIIIMLGVCLSISLVGVGWLVDLWLQVLWSHCSALGCDWLWVVFYVIRRSATKLTLPYLVLSCIFIFIFSIFFFFQYLWAHDSSL